MPGKAHKFPPPRSEKPAGMELSQPGGARSLPTQKGLSVPPEDSHREALMLPCEEAHFKQPGPSYFREPLTPLPSWVSSCPLRVDPRPRSCWSQEPFSSKMLHLLWDDDTTGRKQHQDKERPGRGGKPQTSNGTSIRRNQFHLSIFPEHTTCCSSLLPSHEGPSGMPAPKHPIPLL